MCGRRGAGAEARTDSTSGRVNAKACMEGGVASAPRARLFYAESLEQDEMAHVQKMPPLVSCFLRPAALTKHASSSRHLTLRFARTCCDAPSLLGARLGAGEPAQPPEDGRSRLRRIDWSARCRGPDERRKRPAARDSPSFGKSRRCCRLDGGQHLSSG